MVKRLPMNPGALIGGIIPAAEVQKGLKNLGYYTGISDGIIGQKSIDAMLAFLRNSKYAVKSGWPLWTTPRLATATLQILCHIAGIDAGSVDGMVGPQTSWAFGAYRDKVIIGQPINNWRDKLDDTNVVVLPVGKLGTQWPKQSDVTKVFGPVGQNQGQIAAPWAMHLSWDVKATVKNITLHEKVCKSAERIFGRIKSAYSPEEIIRLGLNRWGGSLNVRKMRGGSAWSMHSWGIAMDFDPDRNQLEWKKDKARLAKDDALKFWTFWEEEGWVSLGRSRDFDWMHAQASRL